MLLNVGVFTSVVEMIPVVIHKSDETTWGAGQVKVNLLEYSL